MPIPCAKASLKVRVSREGGEWVEPQLDDGYFLRYIPLLQLVPGETTGPYRDE